MSGMACVAGKGGGGGGGGGGGTINSIRVVTLVGFVADNKQF